MIPGAAVTHMMHMIHLIHEHVLSYDGGTGRGLETSWRFSQRFEPFSAMLEGFRLFSQRFGLGSSKSGDYL